MRHSKDRLIDTGLHSKRPVTSRDTNTLILSSHSPTTHVVTFSILYLILSAAPLAGDSSSDSDVCGV